MKTIRIIFALLIVALLFAHLAVHAQTNFPATPAAAKDTIEVSNTEEAFGALLHFSGFSATDIAIIALLAKATCGYIRNFLLKNKVASEVGPIARGIAHVAGDSLPKLEAETETVTAASKTT
jgi:hypothetical protein